MKTEFAGFAWPKQEWALPKGKPSQRVRKTRYTGGYYQNAPCMAGNGEIGFYWGEGGEPSGRLWTLRAKLYTRTSWYCDSFQSDTLTAFVFALPHGRGWLAGWTMGDGMIACVDRHIHTIEHSAMWEANEMARIAAERMREDDEKWQIEQLEERMVA